MKTSELKDRAHDFLKMVVARKIDEAFDIYIAPDFIHHNQYTPDGREAFKQGTIDAHTKFPNTQINILRTIAEDDMVVTYSHLKMQPEDIGMVVVHMFRFEGDKIAELWDVAQEVKRDSPNKNGIN